MKDISVIVWDLDNTLYPFDDSFYEATHKALTKMILEVGIDMTVDEAQKYAEKSYPMKTISKLCADFNIEIETAFSKYYDCLDEGFLKKDPSLIKEMKTAQETTTLVILSHANRNWTIRALKKLGLLDLFDQKNIFTSEDIKQGKSNSTAPFEKILNAMNVKSDQILMVEDKLKNLEQAKKTGMKTALVTYKDKVTSHKWADVICENPANVLSHFNKASSPHKPYKKNKCPKNIP